MQSIHNIFLSINQLCNYKKKIGKMIKIEYYVNYERDARILIKEVKHAANDYRADD